MTTNSRRRASDGEVARGVLKVVSPAAGSAFRVAHDRLLTCAHVCVPLGEPDDEPRSVTLKYTPAGSSSAVTIPARYLPGESTPSRDIAVLQVDVPPNVDIPILPLSLNGYGEREPAIAFGFPENATSVRLVRAVTLDYHPVQEIEFHQPGASVRRNEVLVLVAGDIGFLSRQTIRSAMSGGPLLHTPTGTIVGIVAGFSRSGSAESYAIPLTPLADNYRDGASAIVVDRADAQPVHAVTFVQRREWLPPVAARPEPWHGGIGDSALPVATHHDVPYVRLPPGEYIAGPPHAPKRTIIEQPFWLSQLTITLGAYARFRPSREPGYADHPKVNVSWNAADAYCRFAGGALPSEAQWEYAARGGLAACDYPWGPQATSGMGNFSSAGKMPSGTYPPNPFGIFDISGNVWEWCSDAFARGQMLRAVRGGSWSDDVSEGTVWARAGRSPQTGYPNVGFRCVLPD